MDHQPPLYDRDFYAWTQDQAAKLRALAAARVNQDLDYGHLAEEVEDMGKSDLLAYESELARVLEHLLKLEHSRAAEPRLLWVASVDVHRAEALRHLDHSPSLKGRLRLDRTYRLALKYVRLSFAKHGEPLPDLPAECPYSLDQVLDEDWFPRNRHGLDG